ncbi:MAG: MMPL family transporter, partial [Rhodococcus sp. (in: high G+C Gram-positive bacteria)]
EEAVKFGTERTGRIVTAAALLLIVVTGAFAMSGLSVMKFLGVGMIVALIVDATIIRMLLVPSLVKLMGEANWWAPAWMKKVHAKVGIGH